MTQWSSWSRCIIRLIQYQYHQVSVSSSISIIKYQYHQVSVSSSISIIQYQYHQVSVSSSISIIKYQCHQVSVSSSISIIKYQYHPDKIDVSRFGKVLSRAWTWSLTCWNDIYDSSSLIIWKNKNFLSSPNIETY